MLESFFRDPTKLPEVPQPEISSRPFVAFVIWVAMVLFLLSGIVGLFMSAFSFAWVAFGLTFALYAVGHFVLPK